MPSRFYMTRKKYLVPVDYTRKSKVKQTNFIFSINNILYVKMSGNTICKTLNRIQNNTLSFQKNLY